MTGTYALSYFDQLLDEPTEAKMLARIQTELDWQAFERFVERVFQRAGYYTENTGLQFGQGIDIKLYQGPGKQKLLGCVSVKFHNADANRVGQPDVLTFQQATSNANAQRAYIVTNTGFTQPAYNYAMGTQKVRPVDGPMLFRYIAYLRGTRLAESNAPLIEPDWLFRADGYSLRPPSKTKVLTIANNKGGVGKTTTALYLARRLAGKGKNVLLVDFDSQSNSTQTLPNPLGGNVSAMTLVDYFENRAPLSALIRPTQIPNVFIIPCDPKSRLALGAIKPGADEELRFAVSLHAQAMQPPMFMTNGDFDWIIIDTPPEMTFRVRAALAASHYVLAPFEPGPYQSEGLIQLYETVRAIGGLMKGRPEILGCVVTRWQDNKPNRDSVEELKTLFLKPYQIRLFQTYINNDPNIPKDENGKFKALALGQRTAAQQYTALAEEVLRYVGDN